LGLVISHRARRALCLVALTLCASAAACARSAPAAERIAIDGRALFAQACAKCHAADGSGGLPMAANGPRPVNLTAAEWQRSRSDDEIVATLRDGRGAMPPFKDVISAEQIAALAAYVRTLRRP
jgi:mono/diheme cytochrome c family protein